MRKVSLASILCENLEWINLESRMVQPDVFIAADPYLNSPVTCDVFPRFVKNNKSYYVVSNDGSARSRNTLKFSKLIDCSTLAAAIKNSILVTGLIFMNYIVSFQS